MARAHRDGPVARNFWTILRAYKLAKWARLSTDVDPGNTKFVHKLCAVIVSPDMKQLQAEYPDMTHTQAVDFTHGTSTTDLQLGIVMGHIPQLGSQTFPLAVLVYLPGHAGNNSPGDKTAAMQWFFTECQSLGIPLGRVALFDKDVMSFQGALGCKQPPPSMR